MHPRAASTKLQQALAIGRAVAADYPDPLGNIQRAIEKLPGGHTKESLFVLLDKTKRETALVANQIATANTKQRGFRRMSNNGSTMRWIGLAGGTNDGLRRFFW